MEVLYTPVHLRSTVPISVVSSRFSSLDRFLLPFHFYSILATGKAGDKINIGDTFEAYGALLAGKVSEAEYDDIIENACPGTGSCPSVHFSSSKILRD